MGIQNMAGQTLGNYELLELIGTGGMGAVYSAVQLTLKRKVAVKVLSQDLVEQQPIYIERFNREAQTAARLEHAHIVPVYDYGTIDGASFVAMRLLTGGTLLERLESQMDSGDPLPSLEEIATVLAHLGSALDYAHSQDVIHRDIKPSNIMFDNQGSTFIVDFGIAKLMTAQQAITKSGIRMGTPTHMAPEQWRVEAVVPATDQYALGVITYSMVTGRVPFEAITPYALMNKHLNETPTPPRMFRPNTSKALEDVLKRAMAKAPADRFPSCTAFAEAFAQAAQRTKERHTGFFRVPSDTVPAMTKQPIEPTPHEIAPRQITPDKITPSQEKPHEFRPRQVTPTPPGRTSRPSHPARPNLTPTPPMTSETVPLHKNPVFWIGGIAVMLIVIGIIVAILALGGNDDTHSTPIPSNQPPVLTTESDEIEQPAAATSEPEASRTTEPTTYPLIVIDPSITPTSTATPAPDGE